MAEKKSTTLISAGRTDVLSRTALLKWVNELLELKYEKIEEMCSGVAYCQIMELLHPKCIGKSKIKADAKLDYEYTQNFKLLQLAFNKLNIDKTIPIDRLVRGKFQDNLEFLQWFKKFYDSQLIKVNPHLPTETNKDSKIPSGTTTETIKKSDGLPPKNVEADNMKSRTPSPEMQTPPVFPLNYLEARATLSELREATNIVSLERMFYYNKLVEIKNLLQSRVQNNEDIEFCTRALEILQATDVVEKADNGEST